MAKKYVLGADEIFSKLSNEIKLLKLEEAAVQAALIVEQKAIELVPVDKGDLRRSIHSQVFPITNGIAVSVGSPLEYAPYVEFGTGIHAEGGRTSPWRYQDENGQWHTTSGQAPQPYLAPALYENRNAIVQAFNKVVSGGIKK